MVFGFLFGTKKNNEEIVKKSKEEKKKLYLVVNKASQLPIGIFSSLEIAIKEGVVATYHNCQVLEFTVDDKCKYLTNPIYEN